MNAWLESMDKGGKGPLRCFEFQRIYGAVI